MRDNVKLAWILTPGTLALVFWLTLILGITGCNSNPAQRHDAVVKAFAAREIEVKATSYGDQYIVRCEDDGSIWEIKASTSIDGLGNIPIIYKNCLFDPLYKIPDKPVRPPKPPLPLEQGDGTNTFNPTNFG